MECADLLASSVSHGFVKLISGSLYYLYFGDSCPTCISYPMTFDNNHYDVGALSDCSAEQVASPITYASEFVPVNVYADDGELKCPVMLTNSDGLTCTACPNDATISEDLQTCECSDSTK